MTRALARVILRTPPMIDWSRVDTVLLDMDGTLLDLHFDSYFWLTHLPQRYAQIHGMAPEQARQQILGRIQRERGTLNWYCVDYWSDTLSLDVGLLKTEVQHKIGFRPHAQDFLHGLKHAGFDVHIVTNAHHKSLNLKLALTGLDRMVDQVFTTHSFGRPKEDPGFWDDLQTELPFQKHRTLLVDDSLPVLESAERWGIGQLLAVLAPDSQEPPLPRAHLPAVHHFDEILPNLTAPRNIP